MDKIGILYICTGNYDIFFDTFYQSAEQYLLPDCEKHYFVFTESEKISNTTFIHKIYQERLGWPNDTLMRFHLFLNIETELKKMDFLFFFNANYTFTKSITKNELLPKLEDNDLVGQIHPVAYHKKRNEFAYENNQESTAYIPTNKGKYYFAGGLIGGKTNAFLQMCKQLKNDIDTDIKNNITAVWHDESHINKYFSEVEPKKLHPGFCYPEDWYLPFEQKTLLLDKSKLGGHTFLRGEGKQSNKVAIKQKLFYFKLIIRAIFYKLLNYSPI
ncbi:MAG TPA: family 6 glucosyltransferase [Chitinophagales bacterium]|nr:family 6 glucosyltransferase [Chitinophagales bacterium]HNI02416.1 family 6 glucosyltransferase [Chitinophagales bacterium]